MYNEKIFDATTGKTTLREYTAEEIAEVEKAQAEIAAFVAKEAEADAAKAHERAALLERLGITQDEARLLLGGN